MNIGKNRIDHVAIVGGGFSGTLQAIALLRAGVARITLIERRPAAGRGVAYSTASDAHLLNVRTANMSAFPHDPDHFRHWLAGSGSVGDNPQGFASRRDYGDYLTDLLRTDMADAPGRLTLLRGDVVEVERRPDGVDVLLNDGGRIAADAAILALGNLPPHDPPGIAAAALSPDIHVIDPWSGAVAAGLGSDDVVLLVGSGLTMVDVALTLREEGFAGRIVAMSRRGLLPRAHEGGRVEPAPAMPFPSARGSSFVRAFRRDAERHGWQAAVDRIRPHVQQIWQDASPEERRRFLRHLRPYWDVHRHRLSPAVAARIDGMLRSGQLSILAGRIRTSRKNDGGAEIAWTPRGATGRQTVQVRRIVNCTGPHGDLLRTSEPLLHFLLASGSVRPDSLRLGIDVNRAGETIDVNGNANPRLLAVGPMTRGAFWEIVAVPDIRVQTWALAQRLAQAG